jgi:hypothetical protein
MAVTTGPSEEIQLTTLMEMRRTFGLGEFDATLGAFNSLGNISVVRTGIRVEAMCIAARSFAAKGDRKAARNLLRPLVNREYPSPRFYGYVAAVFLDLRDYQGVAQICEKAAALALTKRLLSQSALSDAE